MVKRLSFLFIAFLVLIKSAEACSPLPTPVITSTSMVGSNLFLNLQSQSIYNCSYSVEVEMACLGGTMSGLTPFYYTSPAFNSITNPFTIPQNTVNLTGLCQGGVYQYRFRQTAGGASSPWSVIFTFTMPGVPIPTTMTVTANPTIICFPQTSQLQASVSGGCGGGGGATYSWTPATGLSCTNCANPVANPSVTTTYSCVASGTGQTNCWQVSGTVTVVSPPSGLGITVSNQTICAGASATITAANAPTYTWNVGPTTNSIVVSPGVSTTYTVSGGAAPCIGSATVNVTVLTVPNAPTVTPNNIAFCQNTYTVFTAVSNATNFAWYASIGGSIIAMTNTLAMPPGPGVINYWVAATNALPVLSGTATFTGTGSPTTFIVPLGVTQITVDVWGAEGGDAVGNAVGWVSGPVNLSGGDGGRVQAVITTTPGETLNLYVGTKGTMTAGLGSFNGGGFISNCVGGTEVISAGGGGASDIRRGGAGIANRIIVAGGGGGASGNTNTYMSPTNSGPGGGLIGASATNLGGVVCVNGLGGSQVAGGTGGNNACWCGLANVAGTGSLGLGGVSICAPSGLSTCGCNGTGCTNGGGGGGGYWGGGAGICFAGGGGGSNYVLPSAISFTHTQGVKTGNGLITINWNGTGACMSPLTAVQVTILPCVLPMQLTSFDAVKENDAVKLTWTTKTEKNTDQFIIERSSDVSKWAEICTVKAAGNINSEKQYDCYDATPLHGHGYYRLKTLEIDKTFSYSDVRMVQFTHSKGTIIIHPNPVHDKLYVSYVGDISAGGIVITDARGSILIKDSEIKAGSEKGNIMVDISKLLPGVYFVVVTDNGIKQAKKFIVE